MHEWGQPVGSIVQFAYVVEDIDAAIATYVERLHVGPWFVRGPFRAAEGRYRGEPTAATFTLARAFSGGMMVELVSQQDDSPSVFNERPVPERWGFHHWARFTRSFEEDLARYAALGWEEAFAARLPSGARIVYVDSTRDLPGMLEVVEHTEAQEEVYAVIHRASIGWDGSDPVRKEG